MIGYCETIGTDSGRMIVGQTFQVFKTWKVFSSETGV
jgi:hypothetical protein